MLSFNAALAGILAVLAAFGQATQQGANPGNSGAEQAPPLAASSAAAPTSGARSRFVSSQKSRRAENFYKSVWGIDELGVREAASGSLLRFSYRVLDANKAQILNDNKATPYLVDEKTGAVLQVPDMPKVGKLRQTANPENGREYWIAFSNKGVVKPGSRVDVVVGNFRAIGLAVR